MKTGNLQVNIAGVSTALLLLCAIPSGAFGDIVDSTLKGEDYPFPIYSEVRTHPQWQDIQDKPATATRWPSWNELTEKPATATRWPKWSEIRSLDGPMPLNMIEAPGGFPVAEHDHDSRYIKTEGNSSLRGRLTFTNNFITGNFEGTGGGGDDIFVNSWVHEGNNGPGIIFSRTAGTSENPEWNKKGALLTLIASGSYNHPGGDDGYNADMRFIASDDWSKGYRPTKIRWSARDLDNKMQHMVFEDGKLVIGGSSKPQRGLDVRHNDVRLGRRIFFTAKNETNNDFIEYLDINNHIVNGSTAILALFGDQREDEAVWKEPTGSLAAHSAYFRTRIGVGTHSPKQALHVEGAAIIGTKTGHPDWYGGVISGKEGVSQQNSPVSGAGYVDTPWVYTRAIESDARGSTSTLITLGNNNGYTDHDQIGFVTNGTLRAMIRSSGVGIGTDSPQARLHVAGNVLADNYEVPSDRRLKENIEPIEGALNSLKALKGVRFTWKDEARSPTAQIGLIAQDVEGVFPELINRSEETGYLSVNYSSLVAPVINAVKELDARTENMDMIAEQAASGAEALQTVKILEERNAALEERIAELERLLHKVVADR